MISTYRELINYLDNINELNDKVVNDLNTAKFDLSQNIQLRVDYQMDYFIKDKIVDITKKLQNNIKKIDDFDTFQLELIGLKIQYQLLVKIATMSFISEDKRNKLKEYIYTCARAYEQVLLNQVNVNRNDKFNMIVNNIKLSSLEDK